MIEAFPNIENVYSKENFDQNTNIKQQFETFDEATKCVEAVDKSDLNQQTGNVHEKENFVLTTIRGKYFSSKSFSKLFLKLLCLFSHLLRPIFSKFSICLYFPLHAMLTHFIKSM